MISKKTTGLLLIIVDLVFAVERSWFFRSLQVAGDELGMMILAVSLVITIRCVEIECRSMFNVSNRLLTYTILMSLMPESPKPTKDKGSLFFLHKKKQHKIQLERQTETIDHRSMHTGTITPHIFIVVCITLFCKS